MALKNCLKSKGNISTLALTDNILKTVIRLPKNLKSQFYKNFKENTFSISQIKFKDFDSRSRLRVNCLANSYMIKERKPKVSRRFDSCNKKYPILLYPITSYRLRIYQNHHRIADHHNTEKSVNLNETKATVHTQIRKIHTFLQVVPIILLNGPFSIETKSLLDCGSEATLLRKDIAKR